MNTIIFFTIKTPTQKLSKIYQIALRHIDQKEPLLLLAADKTSFDFLDQLLWTSPPESFLPHPSPLLEISLEPKPGFSIFNLRPTPFVDPAKTVYEFEDHTSPEKIQLSKHRYETYRDQNFSIIIEN